MSSYAYTLLYLLGIEQPVPNIISLNLFPIVGAILLFN